MGSYLILCDLMRSYAILWDLMGPYGTLWDHIGSYGILWSELQYSVIVEVIIYPCTMESKTRLVTHCIRVLYLR